MKEKRHQMLPLTENFMFLQCMFKLLLSHHPCSFVPALCQLIIPCFYFYIIEKLRFLFQCPFVFSFSQLDDNTCNFRISRIRWTR